MLRMESLFKSMFNQNGHVEKELCELEPIHQIVNHQSNSIIVKINVIVVYNFIQPKRHMI